MDKSLNVGVVGCGYWGPNLIRNFRSLGDCSLKAVCDPNDARLKHMGSLYPEVALHENMDTMLEQVEIDALVIATPVHLHHALAKKALTAGKHVFIEKPMTSSAAESRELCDLAKEKQLTLMVGHTFLYSPPVRKIKDTVASGEIGDLRYISARRLNLGLFQKDINVVWDLAPHDISIILHIMNDLPVALNCQGQASVTPGIEDVANMTLFFSRGGYATIHSSWLDPKKVREMTIVGTKKMIVYDDLEPLQKIKIFDTRVEVPPHYDTFAQFHYSYHYGDMHAPYIAQEEPLKVECQHFLDCCASGAESLTSGRNGLEVVQILEAASASIRQKGAQVEIPSLSS